MTYANDGTLKAIAGKRDEVVAILLRPKPEMASIGCLAYDVGINDDSPCTVYVSELWTSKQAHADSLQLESVRVAIAEAMPMLTGEFGGHDFEVLGSPLSTE